MAEILERASAEVQRRCHAAVRRALARGELVKPAACVWCDAPCKKLHGHHPDYNRPLMVLWLCPSCHATQTQDDCREYRIFHPRPIGGHMRRAYERWGIKC
jgi:hypothetical protein